LFSLLVGRRSYIYKGIQFPAAIFFFFLLHAISCIFYNIMSFLVTSGSRPPCPQPHPAKPLRRSPHHAKSCSSHISVRISKSHVPTMPCLSIMSPPHLSPLLPLSPHLYPAMSSLHSPIVPHLPIKDTHGAIYSSAPLVSPLVCTVILIAFTNSDTYSCPPLVHTVILMGITNGNTHCWNGHGRDKVESRELMVGYGCGLVGRTGLNRRMTHQIDRA
jgi:hypothetical protein